MDGRIQYLNTDLVLKSAADLTPLASAFESRSVFHLFVQRGDDGFCYATFSARETFAEPAGSIVALLDAIESLEPSLKELWSKCELREFNIGYDCGDEPWAFNQGLCRELLGRMADVGASLRWTIYPDRPA